MNELDLTGNCLADQFFSFVKKKFVFFKRNAYSAENRSFQDFSVCGFMAGTSLS